MGWTYTDQTETPNDKILLTYTTPDTSVARWWYIPQTSQTKTTDTTASDYPVTYIDPYSLLPKIPWITLQPSNRELTPKTIDEMMQLIKLGRDAANKRDSETTLERQLERQAEIDGVYNHIPGENAEHLSELQDEECRRLVEESES